MRIGIDARLWDASGVGRYIRNIIVNLSELDKKNDYVIFISSKNEKEVKDLVGQNFQLKIADIKPHSFQEQIQFPKILKKENLDLVHFPYFSIPIFYRKPFVVTIHDLIYHHYATGEASTLPYWLFGFKMFSYRLVINTAVSKAKKIITVSNFAKKDIIKMMHVDPDRISVVYESADDFKLSSQKSKYENYFLYVGNIYPHKNVDLLIKAFKDILKERNVKLIFVGKEDSFYKKLKEKNKDLFNDEKIILLDKVNDTELSRLYKNSIALIRPSLMEGFSLPPIESLEAGSPVLVSDIPVHKEILGEGAVYFDVNDEMDLVSKMKYMLNLSAKQREGFIKKGREKIKELSWKKAAQQTLQVYENVL